MVLKRCLLKSSSCIGTQQKIVIDKRKSRACSLMKLRRRSGCHGFGDVIIGIKFQLGPDTKLTNPIGFGSKTGCPTKKFPNVFL